MQTLSSICNSVQFAGIIHAKGRQIFLLISKLKSLQNIAQTSAKGLNANIKLLLQFGPFSRFNSCKRQANLSACFLSKILAKYSSNVCKNLNANINLPLQYGQFSRYNPCKRQENVSAYFQTRILAKYSSNFRKGSACKH